MISTRKEKPGDIPAIARVNELAFAGLEEAGLVDKLRRNCPGLFSLVALDGGKVVGHILFSPVTVKGSGGESVQGMGLGPMAVLSGRQREGIGSRLFKRGLAMLKKAGCPFVIVLGHADYYPRFGFEPASRYGITSQWKGVPDEAFMAVIFNREAIKDIRGVASYRDEFSEAMRAAGSSSEK